MATSKRTYDSTSRREKAQERRDHVIDVAVALFSELGFEGTTLAEIAQAAGVSEPYLQKLGSKADLFVWAIEALTVGMQRTVERAAAEFTAVRDTITRDQFLDMTATSAEWNSRSYGLWRAWSSTTDPELRLRWVTMMRSIRDSWRVFLESFDDRGWWRTDLPREDLVTNVWLITMAETYEKVVVVGGLSHEEYKRWLRNSIEATLIGSQPA